MAEARHRRTAAPLPAAPPLSLSRSSRLALTVLLLGVLATAVALVLAQSAGAIHLGFLGPVS